MSRWGSLHCARILNYGSYLLRLRISARIRRTRSLFRSFGDYAITSPHFCSDDKHASPTAKQGYGLPGMDGGGMAGGMGGGMVMPDARPFADPFGGMGMGGLYGSAATVTLLIDPAYQLSFMTTGHILIAALLGWMGGWFANSVRRRNETGNSEK